MAYDVTIQIVNYKTKQFLEPLLESLFEDVGARGLRIEVNILDNASGNNLDDIREKWQKYGVAIHYSGHNGGFGAGHNQLAAKAKGTRILILNPDIYFIEKHTLARLIDTAERNHAAVVGPRLLAPTSRRTTDLRSYAASELEQQKWDHGFQGRGYTVTNQPSYVRWVSGAVFLIDTAVFLQAGGFDEKFFLYWEEVDLCQRLRRLGYRIFYNPQIKVLHYGHAVASKMSLYHLKSIWHWLLLQPKYLIRK